MIFRKTILFIFPILLVQVAMAQGSATIKASVNKNRILLGESLVLTIEAYLPSNSKIKLEQADSIAHFEFLEKPVVDSSHTSGGVTFLGKYTITSFDSGHWVIPSFTLTKGVKTDTIPIDVVFSDFNPEQDYHDIKDVLEVKVPKKKIAWWIYAAGLLVLILLIAFLTRRKKKLVITAAPKITVSPYEEAMRELEQLQKRQPEAKEYYSKLVNIFRLYIFRKKGILSLQKTTDDLVVQLKGLNLDKEQFDKLSQSLRLSDFVKFAKYIPSGNDKEESFKEIEKAIINIEKSEDKVLPEGRI
jgi:hypothetical protein